MEGTRPLVLLQPAPTGERDGFGQPRQGVPITHRVLAIREDKPSAGEGLVAPEVRGGVWSIQYRIREESVHPRPTEEWTAIDEDGTPYNIVGVFEKTVGARARWLVLVVERTTA